MRLFLLLIAVSLSACSKIVVDEAEVKNIGDKDIERIEFKTLNTDARKALNAADPDALIAVFDESGVTFYGAPGKAFRLDMQKHLDEAESNESKASAAPGTSKIDLKDPVNEVLIKTFVNSPACQFFLIAGNRYWYPSNCPR